MCHINPKFKKEFVLSVATAHGTQEEFEKLVCKKALELEIALNADSRLRWHLSDPIEFWTKGKK